MSQSSQHQNACLNDLLIRVHRCLLQYVGECWPWSGEEDAQEQTAIFRMVEEQQDEARMLIQLLQQRGQNVDFGQYPTSYTDLHYIGLDYLLDQLIAEQKQLIQDVQNAITECASDSDGRDVLTRICSRMRSHLDKLNALASARTATGAS